MDRPWPAQRQRELTNSNINDGIWTAPVSGGQEEAIPELNRVKRTRSWALRENGVYFYEDGPGTKPQVQFFHFTTRRVTTVLRPETGPLRLVPGAVASVGAQKPAKREKIEGHIGSRVKRL